MRVKTINVPAYLPPALHERLRKTAFERRISMTEIIREGVRTYLDYLDAADVDTGNLETPRILKEIGKGKIK